ncbi:MAG: transglutaminase-like domain-containing protein [Candidatus Omnitrophota bacterium]|nr:transglutaminase-like domain-containing protein [Candidatus Omnitrophota bacterium]MDZ4243228.1 transglutaminase-like domain-containing protein [Candidatus Omnitrophota bacterium]
MKAALRTVLIFEFLCCSALAAAEPALPQDRPRRPAHNEIQVALEQLPGEYRSQVRRALRAAGVNGRELIRAVNAARSADESRGLAFLIANMPRRDLRSLPAEFLNENVRLAYRAREETPWGPAIPEEIFLNDVLPYVSLNERRDSWRGDFYERFMAAAKNSGTIKDAVARLNPAAIEELGVAYDAAKRPKPDQSPYESMAAKYASCTGLSVLLVDVLRAVGIPARIAGIPMWRDKSGNHTWVEVWDGGTWHHLGAAEPGPYDQAWFTAKASATDPSDPLHRIYAVSFRRTGLRFPAVWNKKISYIHAADVTARYLKNAPTRSP